jgi:hypothetical protein
LEGKLENGMTEDELLKDRLGHFKFLSFFESLKIEFPGNENIYQGIYWVKTRAPKQKSGTVDCISIKRNYMNPGAAINCRISLYPENHPKKYKLSP